MNAVLIVVSVFFSLIRGVFASKFSNSNIKDNVNLFLFNAISALFSVLILFVVDLVIGMDIFTVSLYSIILAIIFGLITFCSQAFYLKALENGAMSLSTMFLSCGMLIPTIFGMIYSQEKATVLKIIGITIMVVALIINSGLTQNKKANLKWFVFAIFTFVFAGLVGVVQKIHQTSAYKSELSIFLIIAFLFYAVLSFVVFLILKRKKEYHKFNGQIFLYSIVIGVALGFVNELNLYLAGVVDSSIFYPIVNGGLIVLVFLYDAIIKKQKFDITKYIAVGLAVGSIVLLNL